MLGTLESNQKKGTLRNFTKKTILSKSREKTTATNSTHTTTQRDYCKQAEEKKIRKKVDKTTFFIGQKQLYFQTTNKTIETHCERERK